MIKISDFYRRLSKFLGRPATPDDMVDCAKKSVSPEFTNGEEVTSALIARLTGGAPRANHLPPCHHKIGFTCRICYPVKTQEEEGSDHE